MNAHTDTPLIHLSSCLSRDEHFLLPASLLHLLPLSTLSCSLTERQKTKGTENDGQLLPDILKIEMKKDRELVGWCWFVFSRNPQRFPGNKLHKSSYTAENNTVYKDITTLLKCNKTIHVNVHSHLPCGVNTNNSEVNSKNTSTKTKQLIIIWQVVIIILFWLMLKFHAKVFCNVNLSHGLLRPNQCHYLFSRGICVIIYSVTFFSQNTFSSQVSRKLSFIEGMSSKFSISIQSD